MSSNAAAVAAAISRGTARPFEVPQVGGSSSGNSSQSSSEPTHTKQHDFERDVVPMCTRLGEAELPQLRKLLQQLIAERKIAHADDWERWSKDKTCAVLRAYFAPKRTRVPRPEEAAAASSVPSSAAASALEEPTIPAPPRKVSLLKVKALVGPMCERVNEETDLPKLRALLFKLTMDGMARPEREGENIMEFSKATVCARLTNYITTASAKVDAALASSARFRDPKDSIWDARNLQMPPHDLSKFLSLKDLKSLSAVSTRTLKGTDQFATKCDPTQCLTLLRTRTGSSSRAFGDCEGFCKQHVLRQCREFHKGWNRATLLFEVQVPEEVWDGVGEFQQDIPAIRLSVRITERSLILRRVGEVPKTPAQLAYAQAHPDEEAKQEDDVGVDDDWLDLEAHRVQEDIETMFTLPRHGPSALDPADKDDSLGGSTDMRWETALDSDGENNIRVNGARWTFDRNDRLRPEDTSERNMRHWPNDISESAARVIAAILVRYGRLIKNIIVNSDAPEFAPQMDLFETLFTSLGLETPVLIYEPTPNADYYDQEYNGGL